MSSEGHNFLIPLRRFKDHQKLPSGDWWSFLCPFGGNNVVRNVQLHEKQLISAYNDAQGLGGLSIAPVGKTHLANGRAGQTKSALGVQECSPRRTTIHTNYFGQQGLPCPSNGAMAPYEAVVERPIYSSVLTRANF